MLKWFESMRSLGIIICNICNGNFDCTGVWMWNPKGEAVCVQSPAHSLKCVCFLNSLISYNVSHVPLSLRNQGQRLHCSFSTTTEECYDTGFGGFLVPLGSVKSTGPCFLTEQNEGWATSFTCLSFHGELPQATGSIELLLDSQLSESH